MALRGSGGAAAPCNPCRPAGPNFLRAGLNYGGVAIAKAISSLCPLLDGTRNFLREVSVPTVTRQETIFDRDPPPNNARARNRFWPPSTMRGSRTFKAPPGTTPGAETFFSSLSTTRARDSFSLEIRASAQSRRGDGIIFGRASGREAKALSQVHTHQRQTFFDPALSPMRSTGKPKNLSPHPELKRHADISHECQPRDSLPIALRASGWSGWPWSPPG
jgi:hypothetical protein